MKFIEKLLRIGTLLSTLGFIGSILIQIYARFFMDSAPSWTEEASRFFFVYAMSFGAGLAMKDQEFVRLDWIYDKLKDRQQKLLDTAIALITFILFLVVGIYSLQYIAIGWKESSPSLGYSMAIAFTSLLIMAVSVGIYALVDLKNKIGQIK